MAETGATVPLVAPLLSRAGVYSGKPVRGGISQAGGLALASNYLSGAHVQLIPWSFVNTQFTKNGSITLRFKAWCRKAARRRLWSCVYQRAVTTASTFVRFTDPSGGTHETSIPAGAAGSLFRVSHIEDVGTPVDSEQELVCAWAELTNVSAPTLSQVSCVELPRTDLELGADARGVAVSSLFPSATIHTTTGMGLGAVATALDVARTRATRAGLFQFARGANDYLTLSATVGYAAVFAAPVSLLARQLYVGDTVRTVKVRVRASSGAGTTGNIRLTMTNTDSLTLAVTSAMASTWLSGDLDVFCDDLTAADGLAGGVNDKCLIEWERTAGASSVVIESISIING